MSRHSDSHTPSNHVVDDGELMAQAAKGTEGSFELLVRRHTPAVWQMARSLLHDDHAAEDAVQETFLKAYKGLRGFKAEASPKTWLLSICYRTCIDMLRRRRTSIIALQDMERIRTIDGDTDSKVVLEQAMHSLPGHERRAFVLVDVLDYSREEAATIVGVPSSTMRTWVSRARGRMADALSEPAVLARVAR